MSRQAAVATPSSGARSVRVPRRFATLGEVEPVLDALLGDGCGGIAIVESRAMDYRSTHRLRELAVRLRDGSSTRLVLKELSASRREGRDAGARPDPPRDPRREIEVYRDVLPRSDVWTPTCLGSVLDPARGRYWLFLELVQGNPLWQEGDREVWGVAAAELARLHARFAGATASLPARLVRYDAARYRSWLDRARRFDAERSGFAAASRRFTLLARALEGALAALSASPPTFLHGEAYPSNLLVEAGEVVRVRLVDWETAGIGPGALDLAALSAGDFGDDDRAALAEAYRAALPRPLRPGGDALLADLERCRFLIALQWLGWRRRWSPPPHQIHDWMSDACALAESLLARAPGRERR